MSSRFWTIVLLVVGAVLLLALEWILFPLTVDDAYISFRYSENLANGQGLVWNVGDSPVEGYTNFLWVLVGAGVAKLGLPAQESMKLIGMGLSLAAYLLMYAITRLLSGPSPYAVIPALLLAVFPPFALWSVAGLETSLFVCLLLASLVTFLREEHVTSERFFWSPLFLLLLALTRPEGIVVFASLVLARLFFWRGQDTAPRRRWRYLASVAVFGGLWLAYFVWRWTYFGYPFPNTAYVKAESDLQAIAGHIGVYMIPYGLQVFPLVLLVLYAWATRERIQRADLYFAVVVAVLVLVNLISSDWMPGHRLALPLTPVLLLMAREPLISLAQAATQGVWRQRLAFAAILFGLVLYMASPFLYSARIFHRVMATQMDMSTYLWSQEMTTIVEDQYARVGQWLADNAPPGASVVAGNVGAIGFLSGLKVIDMIGLTDADIARNGWTVESLLAPKPDFFVFESDTSDCLGGLYGTSGELFVANPIFNQEYELVLLVSNERDNEAALFIHHLPHATWLFARKDLNLDPIDLGGLKNGTPLQPAMGCSM